MITLTTEDANFIMELVKEKAENDAMIFQKMQKVMEDRKQGKGGRSLSSDLGINGADEVFFEIVKKGYQKKKDDVARAVVLLGIGSEGHEQFGD